MMNESNEFHEHESSEIDEITLESSSPSPVADPSQRKHKGKKLLAFFIGILIVYLFFFTHRASKSDEPKSETVQSAPMAPEAPKPPENNTSSKQNTSSTDDLIERQKQSEEEEKLQKIRMLAPGLMYSADGSNSGGATSSSNAVVLGDGNSDSNSQFMSRVSSDQAPVVNANRIKHPTYTLAQGTLVGATLETQISSDLPGMVRAMTSRNIYSEDGSRNLLPRGSRLIGQYTSSIAEGQQRVFVVWQRVIRPDHIDIQLNSPGTDTLGTAGIGMDSIDRHFWAQFGNALLLSVIGAGTATVGVNDAQDQFNSAAAYREALSNSFSQSASNSLQSTGVIKPTLYINQGKKINVFVARDLDFFNELTRQSH